MDRFWLIVGVVLYPLALSVAWYLPLVAPGRLARFSALASGLIAFLVLWLYVLPRDLEWRLGPLVWESRFVMPLTAYLCGLAIAATLMWALTGTERRRS